MPVPARLCARDFPAEGFIPDRGSSRAPERESNGSHVLSVFSVDDPAEREGSTRRDREVSESRSP